MPDFCKDTNCNFVFPILNTESQGDSLSSINFNFLSLDNELCSIENRVSMLWNPAFNSFSNLSSQWIDAITITSQNSGCWQQTYNTVAEMSGFWLKPVSIIYPYPFPTTTDMNVIQLWLNENFPIKNGNCFNFIVGQDLYVHSAEYASINRTVGSQQGAGVKVVNFVYTCDCIGRGTYRGRASQNVDCGVFSFNANIPDTFINKFVGIKFTADSNFQWSNPVKIFG